MRTYRIELSNISANLVHLWLTGDSMGNGTDAGHLLTREQAEELGEAWERSEYPVLVPAEPQCACSEWGEGHLDGCPCAEGESRPREPVRCYAEAIPEWDWGDGPPVLRCGEPAGVPVPRMEP